ncbi:hypothetical protein RHSIM_Rhsim11G0187300 [Rhododendron simsii]|uniref:Reverse transcriptase zinc-binding domain-containing protein n=1 Tax=Rhododendron simsii TaxID=118357 RepID=A0A834G8M3_RHOSS|nr:hypothetical protein RHSIM_Rhsim11G0187300 [Rhododendron simsii]
MPLIRDSHLNSCKGKAFPSIHSYEHSSRLLVYISERSSPLAEPKQVKEIFVDSEVSKGGRAFPSQLFSGNNSSPCYMDPETDVRNTHLLSYCPTRTLSYAGRLQLITSVLFSLQHPAGLLLDYYGHHFQLVSGIPIAAKVSCIIYNDIWICPFLSLPCPDFMPHPNVPDAVIWDGSPSSKYQASHAWNAFRIHYPIAPWHKVVWFLNNIPRRSFILWMAVRGSLQPKISSTVGELLLVLLVLYVISSLKLWITFFFTVSSPVKCGLPLLISVASPSVLPFGLKRSPGSALISKGRVFLIF